VLTDLLTLALRKTLPRIAWTIGHAGASLVGRCLAGTAAERRRQFDAWCAAAGAAPGPEAAAASGATHLRATAANYYGLVDIVVLADVYVDDETEGDR